MFKEQHKTANYKTKHEPYSYSFCNLCPQTCLVVTQTHQGDPSTNIPLSLCHSGCKLLRRIKRSPSSQIRYCMMYQCVLLSVSYHCRATDKVVRNDYVQGHFPPLLLNELESAVREHRERTLRRIEPLLSPYTTDPVRVPALDQNAYASRFLVRFSYITLLRSQTPQPLLAAEHRSMQSLLEKATLYGVTLRPLRSTDLLPDTSGCQ